MTTWMRLTCILVLVVAATLVIVIKPEARSRVPASPEVRMLVPMGRMQMGLWFVCFKDELFAVVYTPTGTDLEHIGKADCTK